MKKITQRVAAWVEWLFGCTSLPLCLFCPVHLHRTVGFFFRAFFQRIHVNPFFEVRCKLFLFFNVHLPSWVFQRLIYSLMYQIADWICCRCKSMGMGLLGQSFNHHIFKGANYRTAPWNMYCAHNLRFKRSNSGSFGPGFPAIFWISFSSQKKTYVRHCGVSRLAEV